MGLDRLIIAGVFLYLLFTTTWMWRWVAIWYGIFWVGRGFFYGVVFVALKFQDWRVRRIRPMSEESAHE